MKAALVIALEPLSPLAPLAPLAPVTGAELLPPQPAAARIATRALPSARYTHLPHTQRPKVARQPARPGAEGLQVNRFRQPRVSFQTPRPEGAVIRRSGEGSCGPGTRTPNTCSRGRR